MKISIVEATRLAASAIDSSIFSSPLLTVERSSLRRAGARREVHVERESQAEHGRGAVVEPVPGAELLKDTQPCGDRRMPDLEIVGGRRADAGDSSFERPQHRASAAVAGDLLEMISLHAGRELAREAVLDRGFGVELG